MSEDSSEICFGSFLVNQNERHLTNATYSKG